MLYFPLILRNATSSILITIIGIGNLLAQWDVDRFTQYSTVDGFSHNNITAITQDRFGYLWVGTTFGLNRFDGTHVLTFSNQHNDQSIPDASILQLHWLDSNQLLIMTRRGLQQLDIRTLRHRDIVIPTGPLESSYKANRGRQVLTDSLGNMYIITRQGFYHIDAHQQVVFRYDDYLPGLKKYSEGFGVFSAWLDATHIMIIGQRGYYLYNTLDRIFQKIEKAHPRFLVFNQIHALPQHSFTIRRCGTARFYIFQESDHTVVCVDEEKHRVTQASWPAAFHSGEFNWKSKSISLNDSLFLLSSQYAGFYSVGIQPDTGVISLDTSRHFPEITCNTFYQDRSGRLWIGTNEGLYKENRPLINMEFGTFPQPTLSRTPKSKFRQVVTSNAFVFGVNPLVSGLFVFNKSDLSFHRHVSFNEDKPGGETILLYAVDTLLYGSHTGLYWVNIRDWNTGKIELPGYNASRNFIINMYKDSKGQLWIVGNEQYGYYTCKSGFNTCTWNSIINSEQNEIRQIYHIDEGKDNSIWFAGSGLANVNTVTGELLIFDSLFQVLESDNTAITAISCDSEQGIWISPGLNGVYYYNPVTGHNRLWTIHDGLPDHYINALHAEDDFVWITCQTGIALLDTKKNRLCTVINHQDLREQTISTNTIWVDEGTGMLYFGAGNKLVRCRTYPVDWNIATPRLRLESIMFGHDSILYDPPHTLQTNWEHNNITLTFSCINFQDAVDQTFFYRIVSHEDTSWIALGQQHKIYFSSLDTGTHIVEIKAHGRHNRWRDQFIRFTALITPPFWRTIWFYILCAVALVLLGYLVFWYRLKQMRQIMVVRDRISKDLHDEVGATLSGISMYSYLTKEQLKSGSVAEMENSLEIIQQSSASMVTRLNDIIWSVDPQHDSLEKLMQRLEAYTYNMAAAKDIRVQIDFPYNLRDITLPMDTRHHIYLICREAINNAVKYSHATILGVQLIHYDHTMEWKVSDNGSGFDMQSSQKGNGLVNMHKRAFEIGATLTIVSNSQSGTLISLQVPSRL